MVYKRAACFACLIICGGINGLWNTRECVDVPWFSFPYFIYETDSGQTCI
jgi:hypothetical protein